MLYVLGVALSLSIAIVAVLGLVGHAGSTVARYELDARAETALNAMVSRMKSSLAANAGVLPLSQSSAIDGFNVSATATDNSAVIQNSIRIDATATWASRTWKRTSYTGVAKSGSSGGSAARVAGGGLMTYLQPITAGSVPYQYKPFAKLVRLDPQLSYNGAGTGFVSGQPAGWYAESVGWLLPPATGAYTFRILCDDSCRLWVNGQLLIDYWGQSSATYRTGKTINLTINTPVSIRQEFVDYTGTAADVLEWSYPGQAFQTVPSKNLTPAGFLPTNKASYQFVVDPTSSFLKIVGNSSASMPLCIDLWSLGYSSGKTITLTSCGGWSGQAGTGSSNDQSALIACFASTPNISSTLTQQTRISGAISYGTGNSFVAGWANADIPEDFWVGSNANRYGSYTVSIPAKARYLFVCVPDDSPGDNGPASDGAVPVIKVQQQ